MKLHVKSLPIGARMRARRASARRANFGPGRVGWRDFQIRVVTCHHVPFIQYGSNRLTPPLVLNADRFTFARIMLSLVKTLLKRRAAKAAIHQRNIFRKMECDSVQVGQVS